MFSSLTASADRRPVDPPPVVELRIYESDPNNDMHKTDITFAYNANFFLFATLDTARPIAPGRVSGQPPTCPVLTGVPVAGIAYLDRPAQAGYFIFPDLSVRHEGRYRLNFNLYEEVKEPKDADKDAPLPPQEPIPQSTLKPIAPQTYLHFRLEVKSIPFTVYSAKKFPGLATSTSLSRVVAEQGCRVRIRRDVRMRRRGDKQSKDYNEYDEERVYARSDRFSTPDAYAATPIERPRSTSNSTVDAPFAYPPDGQRRPSVPEYGFPQPFQQPPPPTPAPTAYQSHLTFGSAQTQYQTPQLPPTPQPAAPPAAYSPHPGYAHVRRPSNGAEVEPPVQGYPYSQPRPQVEQRFDYPKASLPPLRMVDPPRPVNPQPYGEPRSSDPNAYQSSTQPSINRARTPVSSVPSLPPLKTLSGDYTNLPQPMNAPSQARNYDPVTGKRMLYETDTALSKRSHEDSFGHQEQRPLQNGLRPDAPENAYPGRARNGRKAEPETTTARFFEELGIERASMEYRRADGTMTSKVTPVRSNKV